jgi:membrane protease YdiL (CAAX protease family)
VWAALSYGFFRLPFRDRKSNPVHFITVAVAFAIYLGMTMLVAPLVIKLIKSFSSEETASVTALGWMQLLLLGAIFALFYLYCKAQSPTLFSWIWKDRSIPHPKPIATDFMMGVMTWFIGFPLVLALGQLMDMLLYLFFGFENYEQVAVRYLRTTLGSPSMLAVAIFTILIAAPIIEEFLFRGCLQNFFKRYMTPKHAIMLSALCFSLFHFSASQGLGNISLVASLFLFALFLGFIYERQASLFASVGLHMTFNAVSTFRILFFPD